MQQELEQQLGFKMPQSSTEGTSSSSQVFHVVDLTDTTGERINDQYGEQTKEVDLNQLKEEALNDKGDDKETSDVVTAHREKFLSIYKEEQDNTNGIQENNTGNKEIIYKVNEELDEDTNNDQDTQNEHK